MKIICGQIDMIRHFYRINLISGHILNLFLALVIATIASRKMDFGLTRNYFDIGKNILIHNKMIIEY